MFKNIKRKLNIEKKINSGIFSESTLKTSFYEELQKNMSDKIKNLVQ